MTRQDPFQLPPEPGPPQPPSAPSAPAFIVKGEGLQAVSLKRAVLARGPLAPGAGGCLYHYAQGYWHRDGERIVGQRVEDLLGEQYRTAHTNTIVDMIGHGDPFIDEDNADTRFLNLPNGLLEWRTGKLTPHTPEIATTVRIPIEWHEDATCPRILEWMHQVMPDDVHDTALEVAGYGLYNGNPLHKAILLHGTGRNGKSTYLRLLRRLYGAGNVTAISPQSLDENRFAAAELHGKVANLVGDVDPRVFRGTETFKKAMGEDTLISERKYGQPFAFVCRALMVAAFNELPRTADSTEGFFSKWVPLPFTGYFPAGVADARVEDRLHTTAELQGFLVLAVQALRRVMERRRFTAGDSIAALMGKFREHADPVRSFLVEYVQVTVPHEEFKPRTQVYAAYRTWCHDNGYRAKAAAGFYAGVESAARDVVTHSIEPRKREGNRGYLITRQTGHTTLL